MVERGEIWLARLDPAEGREVRRLVRRLGAVGNSTLLAVLATLQEMFAP